MADVDLPDNVQRILELDREMAREPRALNEDIGQGGEGSGRTTASGTIRNYTVATVGVSAGFRDGVLSMYDDQCLLTEFEARTEFFEETLVRQDGERVQSSDGATVGEEFLQERNAGLEWW